MNKEKLQRQIQEMEAKLVEMKEELNKPKEFEWEYKTNGTYQLFRDGVDNNYTVESTYLKHGRYRTTKANAERALERNRLANRLEALAEQLDSDWVANWSNRGQYKYTIWYNQYTKTYGCDVWADTNNIGQVYMSEKVAKKIVDMLNNGEVVL